MFKMEFNIVSARDSALCDVEEFLKKNGAKLINTYIVNVVRDADDSKIGECLIHTCQGSLMSYLKIKKLGFRKTKKFDGRRTLI